MIDEKDIAKIALELPRNRSNPTYQPDGGSTTACVYTGGDGSHCIAGEILYRMGFRLPDTNSSLNTVEINSLLNTGYLGFDWSAKNLLTQLQRLADSYTVAGNDDAWGMAITKILEQNEDA